MGLTSDYFLTAGPTWCDLLSQDCRSLSIAFERGYAHDHGERMQIVKVGGRKITEELSIMFRPWGLFLRAHRDLYVCLRDLSAQEALAEIVKWSDKSTPMESLLTLLEAKLWSYEAFKKAGVEISMLLLRNSGWELLQEEENLFAYDEFTTLTGEDVLHRGQSSKEATSPGLTFKFSHNKGLLRDRDRFWLLEMELRKILTSSLSARASDVSQVYVLDLNHDGFRFDWQLHGGDRLARLPWPECFLNTSGEKILFAPEISEAVCLKGHLGEITAWGSENTRRLTEWSQACTASGDISSCD
jgi:hypothetical protein